MASMTLPTAGSHRARARSLYQTILIGLILPTFVQGFQINNNVHRNNLGKVPTHCHPAECLIETAPLRQAHQQDASITVASDENLSTENKRRHLLHYLALAASVNVLAFPPQPSHAATATTSATSSPSSFAPERSDFIDPSQAKVTNKVFMNVRISRRDGTFYVRDDLPDTPDNRVFQGRLVIGLFGQNAPTAVERFLSYIDSGSNSKEQLLLDDNPLPSYSRSVFASFDEATGLLMGGMIPSLEVVDVSGSTAIRYGGRLLPATLWVDRGGSGASSPPKISHTAKGLLTHRILDATPSFGITTRRDTTFLDRSHTVFGTLLLDESPSSREFLEIVQDLPTYSVERPSSMIDPRTETVVDDAAQAVFNAQREFFRSAAKSFGDTRLDKVYQGKLLRRVEITQVGLL